MNNFQSNRYPTKSKQFYGSRSNSRDSNSTGEKNTTAQTSKSANKPKLFSITKKDTGALSNYTTQR